MSGEVFMRIEDHVGAKKTFIGDRDTRPVTFRLPKPGKQDRYFGLSRTTYYELEKAGIIRMRRLCKRGNTRGIVLIVFEQVWAYVFGPATDSNPKSV